MAEGKLSFLVVLTGEYRVESVVCLSRGARLFLALPDCLLIVCYISTAITIH